MALGMSVTVANACLADVVDNYAWVQLHVGNPGPAGLLNIAANSTRKQVTWGAPSGGSMANTSEPSWTSLPADEDFTHFTTWSAVTAGTFAVSGLATANAVEVGDELKAPVGSLVVTLPIAS